MFPVIIEDHFLELSVKLGSINIQKLLKICLY